MSADGRCGVCPAADGAAFALVVVVFNCCFVVRSRWFIHQIEMLNRYDD